MVEPVVCVPIAIGTMKSATAAAEPLDEPAGVRVEVVRIAGRPGMQIGEFGGDGLAEQDPAGLARQRDAGGIALRRAVRDESACPIRSACRTCR